MQELADISLFNGLWQTVKSGVSQFTGDVRDAARAGRLAAGIVSDRGQVLEQKRREQQARQSQQQLIRQQRLPPQEDALLRQFEQHAASLRALIFQCYQTKNYKAIPEAIISVSTELTRDLRNLEHIVGQKIAISTRKNKSYVYPTLVSGMMV